MVYLSLQEWEYASELLIVFLQLLVSPRHSPKDFQSSTAILVHIFPQTNHLGVDWLSDDDIIAAIRWQDCSWLKPLTSSFRGLTGSLFRMFAFKQVILIFLKKHWHTLFPPNFLHTLTCAWTTESRNDFPLYAGGSSSDPFTGVRT